MNSLQIILAFLMAVGANAEVVKLGVVVLGSHVFTEVVSHVKLAMKHINERGLFDFGFDFVFRDASTEVGAALRAGLEVMPEVAGLIGTDVGETTLAIAQHATLAGKPVLTPFAPATSLDEKADLGIDSLIRTTVPDAVMLRFFGAVARHYDWREVALITSADAAGGATMRAIEREFVKYGAPTVCTVIMYEVPERDGDPVNLEEGMESLRRTSCRVVLFWPHVNHLRESMKSLVAAGGTQDYVWFSVTDPRMFMNSEDNFDEALLRGWFYIQPVLSPSQARVDAYLSNYANDTQRYICSEGKKVFTTIEEDPTVYDFTLQSGYPDAPDYTTNLAQFDECVDGDGLPGNASSIVKFLIRAMYDAVWIYAEAVQRMIEHGNATLDDVRNNGTWLGAELRNTNLSGLWTHYVFNDEQDLVSDVVMHNIRSDGTSPIVFETTPDFFVDTAFEADCTLCPCSVANCARKVAAVEFPRNVLGDPPHDGRGISLAKSRFPDQGLKVDNLGEHFATLQLFDYFGNPPFFGTNVTVELVNESSSTVWTSPSPAVLPGGTATTQVHFMVTNWGSLDVVVTDVYSGESVELNVQAPRPPCEPGYAWIDDEHACVKCPDGTEATPHGTCAPCRAGWYRADDESNESQVYYCLRCPLDTYQENQGQASCTACPANSERNESQFVMETLSENDDMTFHDVDLLIGTSKDQCMCKAGSYALNVSRHGHDASKDGKSWGARGVECRECPDGATCAGDTYPPKTINGYWGNPLKEPPRRYEECEAGACDGDFACHTGYRQDYVKNRLCSRVEPRYFTIAGMHPPNKCFGNAVVRYLVFAMLFLGLFLLWIYLNLFCDLAAVKLLVEHLQMIAIISDFNVDFPNRTMRCLSLLYDFVLFDVDIVQPTCMIEWSGTSSFYLTMTMPLWGAFFYVPVLCKSLAAVLEEATSPWTLWTGLCQDLHYYKGRHGAAAARATALAIELMYSLYPNICFVSIEMLVCDKDANGDMYTRMDPMIKCGSQQHRAPVAAAAFMILVYIIGFPLAIVFVLQRHIKRAGGVHEPHLVARLGWLYDALASPHHTKCVVPM